MNDCLFCKIRDGAIPAKLAYEDDRCIAFHDIQPQAPTHILIVPRKHVATLLDATDEDRDVIGHLHLVASRLARELGLEQGFRTIFNNGRGAGQSVFHLHLHLLGGRLFSWPPG